MKQEQLAQIASDKLASLTGALKDFRATHLELFKKEGLKLDQEGYKFTALAKFLEGLDLGSPSQELDNASFQSEDFFNFIFVDGKLQSTPSVSGLSIRPLDTELSELNSSHPLSELEFRNCD